MPGETSTPQTRGHRKREKTRRQLVAAGLRVLADKGEGFTVSDVVAQADVSNGTFYNYFVDRDELLDAIAEQLALSLATATAGKSIADPARRFALATARMIQHAVQDDVWARVVQRLASRPGAALSLDRYLREDLAEGLAQGRFDVGPEDAALDQVAGLVVMTIRRVVERQAQPDAPQRAVERGLRALGVAPGEAATLAAEAVAAAAAEDPAS
jgi:AcrR family transcriptional regulator